MVHTTMNPAHADAPVAEAQFPADDTSPGSARALLDIVADSAVPPRLRADAELVISELVANAVEHGDGGPVQVEVARPGRFTLVVTVRNRAEGALPPRPWEMPGPESVRGRGLAVVTALCASVDAEQDGETIAVRAVLGPTPS